MSSSTKLRGAMFAALVALTTAVLSWPALYNRAPLVFTDTENYIISAHTLIFFPARAIGYPIFLRLTGLEVSLWLPIVCQALLCALLLTRLSFALVGARESGARVTVAALLVVGVFSAYPKYTSWLIADFSTGWLLIGPLLFFTSASRLDRALGLGAFALSIPMHHSHSPIAVALTLGATLLSRASPRWSDLRRPSAQLLALALVTSLTTLALTRLLNGRNPEGERRAISSFFVSRVDDAGLLVPFLEEECPTTGWRLCERLPELREPRWPSSFLWLIRPKDGARAWDTPEMDAIAVAFLRSEAFALVAVNLRDVLRQLWTIDAAEGLDRRADTDVTLKALLVHDPKAVGWLLGARQNQRQAVGKPLTLDERWIYGPALLALVWIAWSRRASMTDAWAAILALGFALANASVVVIASGVFRRYQGRISGVLIWIAVVLVVCAAAERRGAKPRA